MRGQTRKRLGRLERLGRLGRIDGGCVFFAEALPGPHLMDGHGAQVKRPTVGLSSVGERIHSANAPKTTTWARFTTAVCDVAKRNIQEEMRFCKVAGTVGPLLASPPPPPRFNCDVATKD